MSRAPVRPPHAIGSRGHGAVHAMSVPDGLLGKELDRDMAMLGVRTIAEIDRGLLTR
jgi:hypothetical protein